MKKILFLFFFVTFSSYSSTFSECECSSNRYWLRDDPIISSANQISCSETVPDTDGMCSSTYRLYDYATDIRSRYPDRDVQNQWLYTKHRVIDRCKACPSDMEVVGNQCLEKCLEDEVRADTGKCVQEEATFECREGYAEQYTIGINMLPTPCSDFDPTMYSDAYTAVHETADTHQVCCVKALPEPTVSTPDSNNTPIDLEPTNEILEDIKESSDSASSQNSDNLAQIDEDIKGTNSRLDDVKEILDGIKTDANQNQTSSDNNRDNNTDRQLTNDNAIANQAHQDQLTNQGKYDDIILNLRTVTPAIQTMTANANSNSQREIDTANANAQESNAQNQENSDRNHEDLEGIKDAVEGLKDDEESEQSMQGALDRIDEAIETASQSRETILGTYSNLLGDFTDSPPTFVSQGACVLDFNIFGRNLSIDMNFLEEMRPYTELFFSLVIAYLTFKIYLGIFIFFSFMIKV